jgi:TorA maturation chaperone TorD
VSDLAGARGDIYRTFASLFLFPDDALVRSLRDAMPDLQAFRTLFPTIIHIGLVERVCRNLTGPDPMSLAGVREAYASLFLTGAGPLVCPAFESAYTRRNGPDAGWLGATLEGMYARAGLTTGPGLPPDHAAVELDFLGFLCSQEASSWQTSDAAAPVRLLRRERTFITQHLGRWFEPFARRLARVDHGGFHSTAASSAAAFLAHDFNLIDGLLTYFRDSGKEDAR